jgi:hypothetical protein
MFSFVGAAVNNVIDKIVDWAVPLETFNFEVDVEE